MMRRNKVAGLRKDRDAAVQSGKEPKPDDVERLLRNEQQVAQAERAFFFIHNALSAELDALWVNRMSFLGPIFAAMFTIEFAVTSLLRTGLSQLDTQGVNAMLQEAMQAGRARAGALRAEIGELQAKADSRVSNTGGRGSVGSRAAAVASTAKDLHESRTSSGLTVLDMQFPITAMENFNEVPVGPALAPAAPSAPVMVVAAGNHAWSAPAPSAPVQHYDPGTAAVAVKPRQMARPEDDEDVEYTAPARQAAPIAAPIAAKVC